MRLKILATFVCALTLPILAEAQVKPQVSQSQAKQAALAATKGTKVIDSKYEKEAGKYIWSFDVRTSGGTKEVWVDPLSGMVTRIKSEPMPKEKMGHMGGMNNATNTNNTMKMTSGTHSGHVNGGMNSSSISKKQAEKIAAKKVGSGKVISARKEKKDKILVWSVDVKIGNKVKDVWVSPYNGVVLKVVSNSGKHNR